MADEREPVVWAFQTRCVGYEDEAGWEPPCGYDRPLNRERETCPDCDGRVVKTALVPATLLTRRADPPQPEASADEGDVEFVADFETAVERAMVGRPTPEEVAERIADVERHRSALLDRLRAAPDRETEEADVR